MKIAVSGASGFVGSALCRSLAASGHQVLPLTRTHRAGGIFWNWEEGEIDSGLLEGIDVCVHLAGENIAGGLWNNVRKQKIRDSRVKGTELLVKALGAPRARPKLLIAASAVGFYGDRGAEVLAESSQRGSGFLSDVCCEWETATQPVTNYGARLVNLRFGLILGITGGAMMRMLLPFKLGLGGKIGSGAQYWSWVTIGDTVRAIEHAIAAENLRGPVNVTAPTPVTNADFTAALARALHRPAFCTVPHWTVSAVLGELGQALLLGSARVVPEKLLNSGFQFADPVLQHALSMLLDPRQNR